MTSISTIETTRTWSVGSPNNPSISVAITTNGDANGSHESLRVKLDLIGMDGFRIIQNNSSCIEFAVDGAWQGHAILDGFKELCK